MTHNPNNPRAIRNRANKPHPRGTVVGVTRGHPRSTQAGLHLTHAVADGRGGITEPHKAERIPGWPV